MSPRDDSAALNADACVTALADHCEDTARSMTDCAVRADHMALQFLLTRRAAAWHRWAGELAALRSGAARGGSATPTSNPSAVDDDAGDAALLAACEQRESRALRLYRDALDEDLPRILRAVLLRHVEGLHDSRAQMRRLEAETTTDGGLTR